EELIQQNATKTKEALELAEQLLRLRLEKETAIARAVDEVRENTRSEVRVQTERVLREQFDSERNALRLKQTELEKQRDDARYAVEELKRRMEQGSQQSQGEALELTLELELLSMFPADRIVAIAKGINGADILQTIVMSEGRTCGSITWETKNAQNWSTKWIDKLRKDMIANKSEFGVLVTTALPEEIRHLGQIEGIWVCDMSVWKAVAAALRRQILNLAFVRASVEGQERKMNILYQYLTGPQFRERVNAIVQTFVAMQEQLGREKRAMTKQWSVREKQIDLVLDGLSGMYGDLQGIIGEASLPEISPFQLVADENEAET
ncbi:MAG: DUF2130 domain-containing protein, partial [Verrucomicrobia bacterium]|nr:DUF2130 domain-containing protein [Verrucomicrobiota bacterium]